MNAHVEQKANACVVHGILNSNNVHIVNGKAENRIALAQAQL